MYHEPLGWYLGVMSQSMTVTNAPSPRSDSPTSSDTRSSAARSAVRGRPYDAQAQMLSPRENRRAGATVQRTAAEKEAGSGDAAIAEAEGMATSVAGEGATDSSPWGKGTPAEPSGKGYFDYDPFADLNQIGQGPDTVPQGPDNQVGEAAGKDAGSAATGGGKGQGKASAAGHKGPGGKAQGGQQAKGAGAHEDPGNASPEEAPKEEVAPPENPDVHLETGGETHVRPAFVGVGGKVKGQFAMKREIKRDLKYATLDSVTFKVDFEASVPGQAGTVTYGGKTESKGGTTKHKKQTELAVPLGEIKPDFAGGELKVALKGGWEHNEDKVTAVTSAEVTWGWCVGEVKIELFGLDSDKGIQPPRIKCSAGGKYSKDHIVQGYKMNLTGKCTVEAEVSPNYVEIGKAFSRVVSRVVGGPGAAGAAGAGAAGGAGAAAGAGEAAAQTGLAAVGTGELLFAAGLLTIPATMVYALYRDAGDIREMKAAGERADLAAKEFIAGYLSPFGIGEVGGEFGPQGEAAGKKQISARLDAMERKYEANRKADTAEHGYDRFGPYTSKDRDAGYEAMKERVKQHAAIFREGAKGAFYWFVRSEIYRAWRKEKELKDGSVPSDQDERVRLYVLGSHAAIEKPQWDKFDTAWRTMGYDG